MKNTKTALFQSVVALLLCVSMLVGTTFAWFTDSATSGVNQILSGNLDVELVDAAGKSLEGKSLTFLDVNGNANILWEPGCTFKTQGFRVSNEGNLALKYTMYINGLLGDSKLLEVIEFSLLDEQGKKVDIDSFEGKLSANSQSGLYYLVGYMAESANNDYQGLTLQGVGITIHAAQATEESDSFDNTYDKEALFPGMQAPITGSVAVSPVDNALTSAAVIDVDGAVVTIPAGTKVENGATSLKLNVAPMKSTTSNVQLDTNEEMLSLDVSVDGVAGDNTAPLTVYLKGLAPIGLNIGNIALHHVHDGTTIEMTRVNSAADFNADNQYCYDPATGDVTLYMATFSEVAVVAEPPKWEGKRDYTWYDASKTDLVIANADQLAAFGAIVGGMDNQKQDSFSGKTVKLIANINIGDTDSENEWMFYPIGYYNSNGNYTKVSGGSITSGFKTFKGTFDGNGHTISDFYQNTWEAFGDYNDGYSGTPNHNRDGFGLFGKVYGGTVKNLTIKNFSSDGEFTTTGCVAAYADCGATFENIAIFNCNPRVYNIGNGGIVGCVGWYANDAHTTPVTFKNITVDNTNKISALWGSWDVACGGLVGQYYPTSGQESPIDNAGIYMENCHVAAQIDVYNDVCANYQYYAYRYAGMLIGSVRENLPADANGHVYPNMDGIAFSGCTVHFGDWNDYYYCELVDNSLASYTHDHQMSRLEQVASVDVANKKVVTLKGETKDIPTSGRANYVVVKAKNANGKWLHGDGADYATCYHFKDGEVWNHADAGKETVNGAEVLKEDKQLIYREFNNLVTGYGWGATSKAVTDYPEDQVKILDREEGNSYVKFEVQDTISDAYRANNSRAIGKLFKAAFIADPNLAIRGANVRVTVSPKIGTDSTAGCIYTPNATDWTKGTLTFTGKGAAIVTITDYYYCISTSVEVEVVENRVTGLSVKTNKNLYDISKSETFKPEDITVTAVYSDGVARTLDVSEFTYVFNEDADDFTTFGEKTGVVTYTYAEDTVTAEFKVVAANMTELALNGAGGNYELYFEQFGINAVAQQFYMAPGNNTNNGDEVDVNAFGAATLEFATGSVNYTVGWNGGSVANVDNHGSITINCDTAPFADIFGYVGYADNRVPMAFGVYVDTVDNFAYTAPMDTNDQINENTGTANSKIFYIQAPLNTMNLSAGEHTVTFVAVFDDGIQTLTKWTVNIEEKEEVDISEKTANVIILAGQSNAYGASALTEAIKAQAVTADYSNIFINYSNINCENGVWKSLYYNSDFESYHPGVGGTVDGACFGPEVGIAYQLATDPATKDEVWYIIKYTAAGSMLDGQWIDGTYDNYGLVEDMGGHLSDLMIDYIHDSLAKIEAIHGDNITIHSFAWMQGESDALAADCAGKYQTNEVALVNKVRNEFASYAKSGDGDNIVFVSGAIAAYDSTLNQWAHSDTVNKAKTENTHLWYVPADTSKNVIDKITAGVYTNTSNAYLPWSAWIDTSTLLVGSIENANGDGAHYGSASMWNLGQWFGIAINYIDAQIPDSDPDSGETATYTVTYNANGGTCGTNSATYTGTALTLPTATREGYTFLGWSDGSTTYAAGTSYTPTDSVTLTAQWQINSYTINVSTSNATVYVNGTQVANGGSTTIEYGSTVEVKVEFSKSWTKSVNATDVSGNILVDESSAGTYSFVMPASNVNIEATSSGLW